MHRSRLTRCSVQSRFPPRLGRPASLLNSRFCPQPSTNMMRRLATPMDAYIVAGLTGNMCGGPRMGAALRHFSDSYSNKPSWIELLREDAKKSERDISYDIKIFDELAWMQQPFKFREIDPKNKDAGAGWKINGLSTTVRQKLCLGDEFKEYTLIGEAMPFPDKEDSPVVNEPQVCCKLYWDHTSPTEKIMVQLSPFIPPLLWIPLKPTLEALRRLFREFLDVDTAHMKAHLPEFEKTQNELETKYNEKFGEGLNSYKMRDRYVEAMRGKDPADLDMDWERFHHFFVGTTESFRLAEDDFLKHNPFSFGWPLLVADGNKHMEDTPLRMAAFRTIFSKSLVMLHSRLDLQIDPRMIRIDADDEDAVDVLEVPLLCTVNFPGNARLCGGAALVKRYNATMGTTWPLDTPVDVIAAFIQDDVVKSEVELLRDLEFFRLASEKEPEVDRAVRAPAHMLASSKITGHIAHTILYLALVEAKQFKAEVFDVYKTHASDIVRIACVKASDILKEPHWVEEVIAKEPEGSRTRLIMERMAGKGEQHQAP